MQGYVVGGVFEDVRMWDGWDGQEIIWVTAPMTGKVQRSRVQVVKPLKTTLGPRPTTPPAPTPIPQDEEDISKNNGEENGVPAALPPARRKTHHPCAWLLPSLCAPR